MWRATQKSVWKDRCESVALTLAQIQQPDGGFDIGYEFNFGRMRRRGQATSPEMLGLIALLESLSVIDSRKIRIAASRAVQWIMRNRINFDNNSIAVPYCPGALREVMVYNGTSFACAALGKSIVTLPGEPQVRRVYEGMVSFLNRSMSSAEGRAGRFWYYCDQSRSDLDPGAREKIDYYHQMQQVDVHSLAEEAAPCGQQLEMVRDAADHVLEVALEQGVVPYCKNPAAFRGHIHLWGYASVATGFIRAAGVVRDRADQYRAEARRVVNWIVTNGWNGKYFFPILNRDGQPQGTFQYMVRSDAWVFNALSLARLELGMTELDPVIESCVRRILASKMSGPESHASNRRIRLARRILLAFAR
jgi:hypothetical protein